MTAAIRLGDVVNFFECEKIREDRRRRVIALKERRRGEVGPYLSFVFENRETLLFQIQQMCRAGRIIDDAKIREEIDVYSCSRSGGADGSGLVRGRPLRRGEGQAGRGPLRAVRGLPGGGTVVPRLRGPSGGGPPDGARAPDSPTRPRPSC